MLGSLLVALAASGATQAAPAEIISPGPDSVAVTIYRDDLALVTETRTLTLPGGEATIAFEGVLDTLLPASAVVRGLEGFEAERNFDFDGLTPASLAFKSIGETVEVVRTAPGSGRETRETAMIAAAGEGIALQFRDRLEALGCSGLPEKLVFARAPDGLRAKPTLSTTLKDAPAGAVTLTLAYLATGLSWEADYVVAPGPDGAARVTGLLTLSNAGEQGFADAQVAAVAGDLSRVLGEGAVEALRRSVARFCYPLGSTTDNLPSGALPMDAGRGAPDREMRAMAFAPPPPAPPPAPIMATAAKLAEQEALADYQLYTLPWRTGLAARQTKHAAFLQRPAATFERVHRFTAFDPRFPSEEPQAATIVLRFENTSDAGLGAPLPKGTARVIASGLYEGEDEVRDTAVGLDWEVGVGASPSVAVLSRTRAFSEKELRDGRMRRAADIEHTITNALSEPARVELVQGAYSADLRITRASERFEMKYGAPTWTLTVPPNAEITLRYTATGLD